MNIIAAIFVFIISAYLNGVNVLADMISARFEYLSPETTELVPAANPEASEGSDEPETEPVAQNKPNYDNIIPQILIDNAAYQKAAVVESILPRDATSTAYDALVNVFCEHRQGDVIQFTTGTGFFIDTAGVIITNAHVAHYLLLDDILGDTKCVVRTGNPAEEKYTADLLYISPAWIRENADMFMNRAPKGTGERDYALLYVTGGVDGQPLPVRFPALPFDTELMRTSAVGTTVYAAGYPAAALIASQGETKLVPKLATTTIAELLTFGSNYADIFSIYGTEIGERGVSGGPILTKDGDTIGLISTKGDDSEFGDGSLRAITMSYIDRTITEETGFSLLQNLSGDIPYRAGIFKEVMVPFLKTMLEQEL